MTTEENLITAFALAMIGLTILGLYLGSNWGWQFCYREIYKNSVEYYGTPINTTPKGTLISINTTCEDQICYVQYTYLVNNTAPEGLKDTAMFCVLNDKGGRLC